MSGTEPGVGYFELHIPLNWDQYFCEMLVYPNTGPFSWNLGGLDDRGQAAFTFALAPHLTVFLGLNIQHCLVVWDPVEGDVLEVGVPTALGFEP